jgi:hypothetical protein
MTPRTSLLSSFLLLGLLSCTSPATRDGAAATMAASASGPSQPVAASFPVAPPPRFDADGRTQEERDLETIGRR